MSTPMTAAILTLLTAGLVLAVAFACVARIIYVIERAQTESEMLRQRRLRQTTTKRSESQ